MENRRPVASFHIFKTILEEVLLSSSITNCRDSIEVLTMTIITLANDDSEHTAPITSMDALIIGTGPAGAALAAFLANYGVFTIIDAAFA